MTGGNQFMRNSRDDKKVIFLDDGARWDADTAKRLSKLASHCDADILLLSGEQHSPSVESLKAALGADKFDRNISDTLFYSEDTPISGIIHSYLDQRTDKISYVIISLTDMEKEFRGYTVYIGKHELLTDSAARTAARILDFGPFWGDYYREHIQQRRETDLIEDYFEKVIFLDIDGVLNLVEYPRTSDEIIVDKFVCNLALIIKETDAEVVLTSSWRYGFASYARSGFDGSDKDIDTLYYYLDKYKIRIAGSTPLYFNGAEGRPFEIRSWLCPRPSVKQFVILDDETFWSWNWLEPHLVCTEGAEKGTGRGLSEEDAYKAIRLLNNQ